MILMTTLVSFLMVSCATTSSVGTGNVNENKLTNFKYLEKICDVQLVKEQNGDMGYLLDGGKGLYISFKSGNSACLLVRDGELYGRSVMVSAEGIIVTFNLHDAECKQKVKVIANGEGYYSFRGKQLKYFTEVFRGMLTDIAKSWGLDEYIKK